MEHGLSGWHTGESAQHPLPLFALQRIDERILVGTETRDEADHETDESKKNILCKTCGTVITSDDAGIAMNGSHEHTFMNPRGLVFHIGCFSKAGGCHIMGSPTDEYTWFPGFVWCYVICSGCLTHLGWHYQSGGSSFFGLILDQLVRQ
jgi:hypothetical protein